MKNLFSKKITNVRNDVLGQCLCGDCVIACGGGCWVSCEGGCGPCEGSCLTDCTIGCFVGGCGNMSTIDPHE